MISAIVDGVLLIALIVTTVKIVTMYRELKRLSAYHTDYQRILDQTALALDGIEVSIQEINVRSAQLLNALGTRMDDARELIAEIDSLTRESKRQQAVLRAELKELSKATARQVAPEKFADEDSEETLFTDSIPASDAKRPGPRTGNRFLTGMVSPTTNPVELKPTRIHRIDDGFGSPFRSISMHQKDDL